ncbi:MAG: hypothetical protein HZB34_13870 [Nitrospirae bacterium]|nr:hypothetical protein [Nitrospirota bacterium]
MKLLFDTDAFCKLGIASLLQDAAQIFGGQLQECGRLYALPFMLKKGRLRNLFGGPACDALIPVADVIPVMSDPSVTWLEKLTGIEAIDPGEAQIFAVAAELGQPFLSGDKRALIALKNIDDFITVLDGRVVILEAVLLALCDRLGQEEMRLRVAPLAAVDRMVEVCFSSGNPDPSTALMSYYRALKMELAPLKLWDPRG